MTVRLPAEWEQQDGILLPWPHPATDWKRMLDRVEPVFRQIATAASRSGQVLIVAPDTSSILPRLVEAGARAENIRLIDVVTDDTWARDFGPITVVEDGRPVLLDFTFNGWGNKFTAENDNRLTAALNRKRVFRSPFRTVDMVLEGGSIDSDGRGNLLTTTRCLLNPNRNPALSRDRIDRILTEAFGLEQILWLESGMLLGDDTDAHVDILARFAPDDTILYVACDDEDDPHYVELDAMRRQLETFRTGAGKPFRLLPLPLPSPRHDADGHRLAATYANFLVVNGAVLVPVYDDPLDAEACARIAAAFPGREIVGIDCSPLILQGGSLHCSTMQLPEGVMS